MSIKKHTNWTYTIKTLKQLSLICSKSIGKHKKLKEIRGKVYEQNENKNKRDINYLKEPDRNSGAQK